MVGIPDDDTQTEFLFQWGGVISLVTFVMGFVFAYSQMGPNESGEAIFLGIFMGVLVSAIPFLYWIIGKFYS